MEFYDIGLIIATFATIINIKNVDWKSPKTYKVAVLTLLAIGLGVGAVSYTHLTLPTSDLV